MDAQKVLIISDWIYPFTPHTLVADATRMHILGMQDMGAEIRSFMPKWGPINERRNQLHEVIRLSGMNLIIDDTDHPLIIKVASLPGGRQQVYFIDNDDFFQNRQYIRDNEGNEYADNDERIIFFARGVLETVKKLRWTPDVIHCHGWLSALIPLYIKTAYKDEPAYRGTKVVSTVYNDTFKENLNPEFVNKLLIKDLDISQIGQFDSPINYSSLIRNSISFSDGVIFTQDQQDKQLVDFCTSLGRKTLSIDPEQNNAPEILNFYKSL
ncbi:MAG: glycogen/starch synthase [Bacteroidaceae bacterium]|nr:glycogen/starch synthase [Bacteroidaceae bacterium]